MPPAFTISVAGVPPWVVVLRRSDFLALVNRILPQEYLQPLQSPGPGYEIYQAEAHMGGRVSLAIANYQTASYIGSSPDGGYATAPVLFRRPTAVAGAVTIKAGTVVQTALYGRQFALLYDVVFGASDVQQPGIVQALQQGEQWNVRGPYVTAGGELVLGEIQQVTSWVMSPPYGDATMTIVQTADATGGLSAVLNQHGFDRGFTRQPGESAVAFRQRIRSLPDTVSPGAIQRTINTTAGTFPNTTWDFIETFQTNYQMCWDCPSPNFGTPGYTPSIGSIQSNVFVYDDPRPAYPPFQNRWLGEEDYRGAFIVVVPVLAVVADYGMAYDDTAQTLPGLTSPNGRRAVPAYDVPSNYTGWLTGCYDGGDDAQSSVYSGLYAQLQSIRAGGVTVVLELAGQ